MLASGPAPLTIATGAAERAVRLDGVTPLSFPHHRSEGVRGCGCGTPLASPPAVRWTDDSDKRSAEALVEVLLDPFTAASAGANEESASAASSGSAHGDSHATIGTSQLSNPSRARYLPCCSRYRNCVLDNRLASGRVPHPHRSPARGDEGGRWNSGGLTPASNLSRKAAAARRGGEGDREHHSISVTPRAAVGETPGPAVWGFGEEGQRKGRAHGEACRLPVEGERAGANHASARRHRRSGKGGTDRVCVMLIPRQYGVNEALLLSPSTFSDATPSSSQAVATGSKRQQDALSSDASLTTLFDASFPTVTPENARECVVGFPPFPLPTLLGPAAAARGAAITQPEEAGGAQRSLLERACQALNAILLKPVALSLHRSSAGGTYMVTAEGDATASEGLRTPRATSSTLLPTAASASDVVVGVFKPRDEEIGQDCNPHGNANSDRVEAFTPGTGSRREVLAYRLDHGGFAGVPPTIEVATHMHCPPSRKRGVDDATRTRDGGHGTSFLPSLNRDQRYFGPLATSQIGSLQYFVPGCVEAADVLPGRFDVEEVQALAIFDIRTLNGDRHGGNVLARYHARAGPESAEPMPHLVPIDHSYICPSSYAEPEYEWLFWPQSKLPFTPRCLKYIASLDANADAALVRAALQAHSSSSSGSGNGGGAAAAAAAVAEASTAPSLSNRVKGVEGGGGPSADTAARAGRTLAPVGGSGVGKPRGGGVHDGCDSVGRTTTDGGLTVSSGVHSDPHRSAFADTAGARAAEMSFDRAGSLCDGAHHCPGHQHHHCTDSNSGYPLLSRLNAESTEILENTYAVFSPLHPYGHRSGDEKRKPMSRYDEPDRGFTEEEKENPSCSSVEVVPSADARRKHCHPSLTLSAETAATETATNHLSETDEEEKGCNDSEDVVERGRLWGHDAESAESAADIMYCTTRLLQIASLEFGLTANEIGELLRRPTLTCPSFFEELMEEKRDLVTWRVDKAGFEAAVRLKLRGNDRTSAVAKAEKESRFLRW